MKTSPVLNFQLGTSEPEAVVNVVLDVVIDVAVDIDVDVDVAVDVAVDVVVDITVDVTLDVTVDVAVDVDVINGVDVDGVGPYGALHHVTLHDGLHGITRKPSRP